MKLNWSLDWLKLQPELDYQKIAPTVTYQDIAISILIDIVSKSQEVSDSVIITDLFSANLIRPASDEIFLSDSVVKYVIKDYFGDTVSLPDVLEAGNQFLRDRFDEVLTSDLEYPSRLPSALLNEGLANTFLLNAPGSSITDRTAVITPTKTDEIDLASVSDILTAISDKIFADTINFSDGIANNISKYLASGLTLDDFADVNKSVNGVKGNITTLSDSISVTLILSRLVGSTTLNEITLN